MTVSTVSKAAPYVLACCTAVSTLSTDLFAPSIPHLPAALGTDANTAQITIGVNLAAYSLAQLFHGPIADAIGRKKLLIWSFLLFAAVSAACALAGDINTLIAGRFAQGVFSSAPSVVVVLIIRELYTDTSAVRAMALYGAAMGVAPAIGPLIGGYLHVWFGWTAGFWLIAFLALTIIAATYFLVPETIKDRRPLNLRASLVSYGRLLNHRGYMTFVAPLSLIFGALFAFVTTGPVVFIDLQGLPTERYGLCYLAIVICFVFGNFLAGRRVARFAPITLVRIAAILAVAGALMVLAPVLAGLETIPLILTGMSIYAMGLGILLAAGPIVALNSVADHPQGPASALLGSFQLGAASLAGLMSGLFYSGDAKSMAVTVAVFVGLGAAPLFLTPPVKETVAAE